MKLKQVLEPIFSKKCPKCGGLSLSKKLGSPYVFCLSNSGCTWTDKPKAKKTSHKKINRFDDILTAF